MVNASRKTCFSFFGFPAGWKERPRKSPSQTRSLAVGLGACVEFSKRKRLYLGTLGRRLRSIRRVRKEILDLGSAKGKSKRGEFQQTAGPNDNFADSITCANHRFLFFQPHRHAETRPSTYETILIFSDYFKTHLY